MIGSRTTRRRLLVPGFQAQGKGRKGLSAIAKGMDELHLPYVSTFVHQNSRSSIIVLSGSLTVGEQPAVQKAYHTLVLSANEGEDGVWLESTEDGLTRGVLIAGEPLQQPVVQVSSLERIGTAIAHFRGSTDHSSLLQRRKLDRR